MAVTTQGVPAYSPSVYFRVEQPGFEMSSLAASDDRAVAAPAKIIQPAWVRTVHWINAVAMILMIMSGWQIYNASPLFDFSFSSSITLGSCVSGPLLWHFAARWPFVSHRLVQT